MKKTVINSARILFIILSVFVFLNGAFIWMTSNFNLGNLLVFALAFFLFVIGAFGEKFWKMLPKWISISVVCLFCIVILLSSFLMIYGSFDDTDFNEDAIIVLGAGIRGDSPTRVLRQRLDAAARYHSENPDAVIVVSGGRGMQEIIPEAEAMKKYLVSVGVNPDIIVMEDRSASTFENFTFSKKILDDIMPDGYRCAFVTNEFHIFRAKGIANNAGFDTVLHLHSKTDWYSILPCVLRECLAVMKFIVFGN